MFQRQHQAIAREQGHVRVRGAYVEFRWVTEEVIVAEVRVDDNAAVGGHQRELVCDIESTNNTSVGGGQRRVGSA